ncbi:MAG: hypothetical protein KDD47_26705 [Acidobacteria bacterium]|nr:hypothetical protein [Acidobacteriota bacterium]
MKDLIRLLALALLVAVLAMPALAAETTAPEPANAAQTGAQLVVDQEAPSTPAANCAAVPLTAPILLEQSTSLFDPLECSGPYPPITCQCGSCCERCKCWQGYILALCGPLEN